MDVNSKSKLLDAVKDSSVTKIKVTKSITLNEPLYIHHSLELHGGGKLHAKKGIRVRYVEWITLSHLKVSNPGKDGTGDGIEVASNRSNVTKRATLDHIEIGECGDEGISIRGCEYTKIERCKTTHHNHRAIMNWLTNDKKKPSSKWRLIILDCSLNADKRLPLSSVHTSVYRCKIKNWTGDCSKTRDGGRITYHDCDFYPKSVNWFYSFLDALKLVRNDSLHVVGNDDNNTKQVSFKNCRIHGKGKFK